MKNLLIVACIAFGVSANAAADGVNKPKIHAPVPSPLNVMDDDLAGGLNAPTVHRALPIQKAACDCNKNSGQQIKLDGDFTGGVGAGIATNWSGGAGGFASPIYPMVRSRSSVLAHPSSAYTVRPRLHKVMSQNRR